MSSNGNTSIIIGILCLVIGSSLTIFSYVGSAEGETHIIFYGAIIYGVYKLTRGIYINSQNDAEIGEYDHGSKRGSKFNSNLSSNMRTLTSDPYKELSISNTISDEDLISSYKVLLNEYNLAINKSAVNLEELRNKIYIYKAIFNQRKINE